MPGREGHVRAMSAQGLGRVRTVLRVVSAEDAASE
jgi:hypothetical protein